MLPSSQLPGPLNQPKASIVNQQGSSDRKCNVVFYGIAECPQNTSIGHNLIWKIFFQLYYPTSKAWQLKIYTDQENSTTYTCQAWYDWPLKREILNPYFLKKDESLSNKAILAKLSKFVMLTFMSIIIHTAIQNLTNSASLFILPLTLLKV